MQIYDNKKGSKKIAVKGIKNSKKSKSKFNSQISCEQM